MPDWPGYDSNPPSSAKKAGFSTCSAAWWNLSELAPVCYVDSKTNGNVGFLLR